MLVCTFLPVFPDCGLVFDPARDLFHEAMALAWTESLPALPGTAGKKASTQCFRPDVLNHIFIPDLRGRCHRDICGRRGRGGLDQVKAGILPLDSRAQLKNFEKRLPPV